MNSLKNLDLNSMLLNTITKHTRKLITSILSSEAITTIPHIILGLSGGPDSVFLLHVLKDLHHQGIIKLLAAHLNHEWREQADSDEAFCANLCTNLNIPFVSEKVSNLQATVKHTGSKEDLGRRLRRFFFEKLRIKHSAHFIALAHHFDDQQETFFMRLIRGTTLSGLHGMRPIQGPYIRPLLNVTKKEILDALTAHNLEFVIDATNESDDFLRNRIRKYALPALRTCDPRFDKNFKATLTKLEQEDDFLDALAKETFDKIFPQSGTKKVLAGNLIQLVSLHSVLLKRVIRYWLIQEKVDCTLSSNFIDEIMRFMHSPHDGSHHISINAKLVKKHGSAWLEIRKQR